MTSFDTDKKRKRTVFYEPDKQLLKELISFHHTTINSNKSEGITPSMKNQVCMNLLLSHIRLGLKVHCFLLDVDEDLKGV